VVLPIYKGKCDPMSVDLIQELNFWHESSGKDVRIQNSTAD